MPGKLRQIGRFAGLLDQRPVWRFNARRQKGGV